MLTPAFPPRRSADRAGRTPDFQTAIVYPAAPPGRANLSMSPAQLAQRYGAVSMTLEMPFKDNDDLPDPDFGWSPARSMQLARDCLAALAEIIDDLWARCPVCEDTARSEEHTSELQSLMRISYAVICLKNKINQCAHH